MVFDGEVAFNLNSCNVVLEINEAAEAAIRELNGTALFSRNLDRACQSAFQSEGGKNSRSQVGLVGVRFK